MIEKLKSMKKKFIGEGINHEDQPFKASFEIYDKSEINGLSFVFEAKGNDGQPFHLESSLVGKNMRGETCLWVLSSNHPGVFERPLRSEIKTSQGHQFIFGFGNKEDRNSFREEIHIELNENTIRYVYFWGMPGGDFAERSGCQMQAID